MSAERFSTFQRVRSGDLDSNLIRTYIWPGESRPIPDVLRERIEPQMLDRVSRRA